MAERLRGEMQIPESFYTLPDTTRDIVEAALFHTYCLKRKVIAEVGWAPRRRAPPHTPRSMHRAVMASKSKLTAVNMDFTLATMPCCFVILPRAFASHAMAHFQWMNCSGIGNRQSQSISRKCVTNDVHAES